MRDAMRQKMNDYLSHIPAAEFSVGQDGGAIRTQSQDGC